MIVTAAGVKVLDFGLAKMERPPMLGFEPPHVTKEGSILGTLHYLSPEQVQGKPAEPSSDIFSFGVVLYEMLTGRRAFDGPNTARVMAAILALEPPPLGASIPRALDLALQKCLAKEPEERWQTARDLKSALELLSTAREPTTGGPFERQAMVDGRHGWSVAARVAVRHSGRGMERSAGGRRRRRPANGDSSVAFPDATYRMFPANCSRSDCAGSDLRPRRLRTRRTFYSRGARSRGEPFPDGKRVAYISRGHLWIAGSGGETRTIYDEATGTPFWSPDGRFVAASTGKELRRFEVGTQNTTSLCAVNTNFSARGVRAGPSLSD